VSGIVSGIVSEIASGIVSELMLLLFCIGENLCAIDTDQIIEILPMVVLRSVQPAPDHIAGVFNYHGKIVPVIDLCRLTRGTPCKICYSTRIIMVNDSRLQDSDSSQLLHPIGLIAERVTETLKLSIDPSHLTASSTVTPDLGRLLNTERGMVQMIDWENLIVNIPTASEEKDQVNGVQLH
jgi:chemotaxis-related protein WspB